MNLNTSKKVYRYLIPVITPLSNLFYHRSNDDDIAMQECVPYELHKTKEINTTEGVYDECQVDPAIANTDTIYEIQPEKYTEPLIFNIAASIIRIIELDKFATKNNYQMSEVMIASHFVLDLLVWVE